MRDWQATQLQASFKGVTFDVDGDSKEGGRRLAVHEYPDREHWDVEDLGRKAQYVSVRAYVTGDGADARCEALFQICSGRGAGLLVLPLRPPVQAECVGVYSTFVADMMGRFNVDLEFVLVSARKGGVFPDLLLAGAAGRAALAAIDAAKRAFATRFDTLRVPGAARDAAAAAMRLAATALEDLAAWTKLRGEAASAAAFSARRIATGAFDLAYAGQVSNMFAADAYSSGQTSADSAFADLFAGSVAQIAAAADDKHLLVDGLDRLSQFSGQAITTPFRIASVTAEKQTVALVAALARRVAVATAGDQATYADFRSRPDAVAMRARIGAMFRREIAGCDDPDLAAALTAARDDSIAFLTRTAAERPATRRIETRRVIPAVVVSTSLYADPERDREIVERNRVPHPLYVVGTIEVVVE